MNTFFEGMPPADRIAVVLALGFFSVVVIGVLLASATSFYESYLSHKRRMAEIAKSNPELEEE